MTSPFFAATIGIVAIALFVFWTFKFQNIRAIKREIAQLEAKLASGQKLWRQFPPLGPEEKRKLQEAQKRLIRKLPEDKDLPSLLQEVSRLAQEHNLLDVSFKTGDTAGPSGKSSVVAATTATPKVNTADDSKAVDSFPIQVSFSGDYKEVAYFLEALKGLPRLVRTQSLQVQRDVPLVRTEVTLQAYYKNEELLAIGK
ncbi:MAG: type 4a pilus biogenesis protein PilO [Candidatus Binatia bacterium]